MRVLFLTGATGVLGREFIKEILKSTDDQLYLLVRRKGTQSHWERIRKILSPAGLERSLGTRVHVLEGDVELPGFGLKDYEIAKLRRKVTDFFHVAALTTLNASEAECIKTNVGGTQTALEYALDFKKNGSLKRFYYFSTAFVSGSRQTYHAFEDELTPRPAFANHYESSKYQAESLVRQAMADGLPATIFRPSIVVGDSQTGEVGEFNVIYPFMKLFAHGILKKIPTQPENAFNIVPIDFVIKASVYISGLESSIGKTYHLVTQEPPSIGMMLKMKDAEFPRFSPVEIIPLESFDKGSLDAMEQVVYEMMEPYIGYLNDHLTFDTSNAEQALQGSGISFPKTDYQFLKTLCQYAVDQGYLILN